MRGRSLGQRTNASWICGLLLCGGCALPVYTYEYTPPPSYDFETERSVPTSFAETWRILIRTLSKKQLTIRKADRESGVLRAVFYADLDLGYVDCGATVRTITQGGVTETLTYRGTEPARFPIDVGGVIWEMERKPLSLRGELQLDVVPHGEGTRVSVNVSYDLVHQVTGTPPRGAERTRAYTDRITSREPSQPPTPRDPTCASTGKLEETVLGFAVD